MRILAIDTALGQCAVGVVDGGGPEPTVAEAIGLERGHAEAHGPAGGKRVHRRKSG